MLESGMGVRNLQAPEEVVLFVEVLLLQHPALIPVAGFVPGADPQDVDHVPVAVIAVRDLPSAPVRETVGEPDGGALEQVQPEVARGGPVLGPLGVHNAVLVRCGTAEEVIDAAESTA